MPRDTVTPGGDSKYMASGRNRAFNRGLSYFSVSVSPLFLPQLFPPLLSLSLSSRTLRWQSLSQSAKQVWHGEGTGRSGPERVWGEQNVRVEALGEGGAWLGCWGPTGVTRALTSGTPSTGVPVQAGGGGHPAREWGGRVFVRGGRADQVSRQFKDKERGCSLAGERSERGGHGLDWAPRH